MSRCPGRYWPGSAAGPGYLGRIGPITAAQARHLAAAAARDPGTGWRIIVTTTSGHALTITRIPRPRPHDHPPRPGTRPEPGSRTGPAPDRSRHRDRPDARTRPGASIGLVGRVTLTIPEDMLAHPPPWPRSGPGPGSGAGPDPPGGILTRALRAAATAAARARAATAADAAAGGCAHTAATAGYRPPPRLKEYIAARDLTCRFPRCRQPAWRGDLDHTIPYDNGGLTCHCNLGGLCRTHHILKHHPHWNLRQTTPGTFTWTTPPGRTHTANPDTHTG